MEFRLLGPVEVHAGDGVLDIGHARQRAVLAALLLEPGRVVSLDRLIDGVWGEDPPASVRNTLSGYVARLRSTLAAGPDGEGAVLARRAGGYVLEVDPGRVDLFRFRGLAADAASALDIKHAAAVLREAVRLWRGPALAGLDSLWLNAMRDTLELERHAVLLDLNDIRLRLGEHFALASVLAGQAADAPADERLIGQLMLALYRCGRQADALRTFERARAYLVGELGVGPSPDLRSLHERILRSEPALAFSAAPAAVGLVGSDHAAERRESAMPVPRELPPDVAAFTGRAAELVALDELLLCADGDAGQVTAAVISAVAGTAGVGKTALALHWAHQAASHFPDGQLHVNLRGYDSSQPVSAADALAGFLRSLGVLGSEIPAEQDERAARYRSLLAGKRMLIVLDNASTVEQVRPLLPGHPACRVLVTSRDTLAGLVARDGARRLDLELLPVADAITLLREVIGDKAAAEPEAVAEIARQCARLPLALRVAAELATSRPATPLRDLAAELADRQARLELLSPDGDPRTAVRAVLSWSYDHLDAESARAFRLAGLHPAADFEPYAIAALTDSTHEQARRMLGTLTRAHLAQPTASGRYAMHDLLRAYASNRAAETDGEEESRAALTRLFDYYVSLAAEATDKLYPAHRHLRPRVGPSGTPAPLVTEPAEAIAWLHGEVGTFAAVGVHAASNGWPGHATRLSSILFRYLQIGGHVSAEATIHGAALRAARESGDHAAEAATLTALGTVSRMQGRYHEATDNLGQALALFRKAGDRSGQARALGNLGNVDKDHGAYQQAARHFRQALALFRELGDQVSEAAALNNLGTADMRLGRHKQAAAHYRASLSLCQEIGDRNGEAVALSNLGNLDERLGRYQRAAELQLRALALFRQTGYRRNEAASLNNLGQVACRLGEYRQAVDWHRQAIEICREIRYLAGEADAHCGVGDALLAAGQPREAEREQTFALALANQIGHKWHEARAHDGLGRCCQVSGDLNGARGHWQRALTLFTELGDPQAAEVRARLNDLGGSA